MAELVDATASNPVAERCVGSSPTLGTTSFKPVKLTVDKREMPELELAAIDRAEKFPGSPLTLIAKLSIRTIARVAKLVDAPSLGVGAARRGGSSPFTGTTIV